MFKCLEPIPLSPSTDGSVCGVRGHSKFRQFSSLPWLLHFPGPSCVSLNMCVVFQSARGIWRAYLDLLLLYHFQNLPIESVGGPSLTPIRTMASGQQSCRFLRFIFHWAATLTGSAIKHGLFTLCSKSGLPLLAAKLVFNSCPALTRDSTCQAGWRDGSSSRQEGANCCSSDPKFQQVFRNKNLNLLFAFSWFQSLEMVWFLIILSGFILVFWERFAYFFILL